MKTISRGFLVACVWMLIGFGARAANEEFTILAPTALPAGQTVQLNVGVAGSNLGAKKYSVDLYLQSKLDTQHVGTLTFDNSIGLLKSGSVSVVKAFKIPTDLTITWTAFIYDGSHYVGGDLVLDAKTYTGLAEPTITVLEAGSLPVQLVPTTIIVNAVDPDSPNLTTILDYGDGTMDTLNNDTAGKLTAVHTYKHVGSYRVVATVLDGVFAISRQIMLNVTYGFETSIQIEAPEVLPYDGSISVFLRLNTSNLPSNVYNATVSLVDPSTTPPEYVASGFNDSNPVIVVFDNQTGKEPFQAKTIMKNIQLSYHDQFQWIVELREEGSSFVIARATLNAQYSFADAPVITRFVIDDASLPIFNSQIKFNATVSDSSSKFDTVIFDPGNGATPEIRTVSTAPDAVNSFNAVYGTAGPYDASLIVMSPNYTVRSVQKIQIFACTPASGAEKVLNISANDSPIVDPTSGISVKVSGSEGGVIELGIVPGFDADIKTEFGDGLADAAEGLHPTHEYHDPGIFVAKITASVAGRIIAVVYRMIEISKEEVGVPNVPATPDSSIRSNSMDFKLSIGGQKIDTVKAQFVITLPYNYDKYDEHDISIGFGNLVSMARYDMRGKMHENSEILKSLKVSVRPQRTTGLLEAQISALINMWDMQGAGFQMSNSANSTDSDQKEIPLNILLDGIPYEGRITATMRSSGGFQFGTISQRKTGE